MATKLANHRQQILGHAAGAMHDQMGVGNTAVDFFDALNGQYVAGGLTAEFVCAVAGANGNGQRVHLGLLDEVGRLLGVGQQLLAGHGGVGAVAIFFVALHGFQRAQATQLAFDGNTAHMSHLNHLLGHVQVVFIAGNGFAVGFKAAVHHDRAEAQINGALANAGVLTVVLVHHQRNLGVGLYRGGNQVLDEGFARVLACARTGLKNHRSARFFGGFHDRLDLF